MCKYNTYAIEIVHINGNRQLREAKDSFSYNSTISLYHDVKEKYISQDVIINFLGFTKDNEQGVIFSKRNTIIENERRSMKELMETIYEASKQLQELYKVISGKEDYYNKKKSNIDHLFIEAIDIDDFTEEEKAKVFDEIRDVNLMRRDYKILNGVKASTHTNLNYIVQKSKQILDKYNEHIDKNNNKLRSLINRDSEYIGVHLIKEIHYKDFQDRIKIMKRIEKQYDRVVHLPERNVLACYNKCG